MAKKYPTIHIRHFNEKISLTTKKIAQERMAICHECGAYEADKYKCGLNGVFMPHKTREIMSRCPSGLWGDAYGK